jgi:hypothetical protein
MSALKVRSVGTLFFAVMTAIGCGDSKKIDKGTPCLLNSDCNNPLSCVYGKCHEGCRSSTDCTGGAECTKVQGLGVCLLPEESACTIANPVCNTSLACAVDLRCRSACTAAATDCMGSQLCVQGYCADPGDVDKTTGLLPVKYTTLDGGTDGPSASGAPDTALGADGMGGWIGPDVSGTGGVSGSGGSDSGVGTADSGAAGVDGGMAGGPGGRGDAGGAGGSTPDAPGVVSICPQTQFGFIADGDSNPNFVSGVGVRTATQLLVFSGYHGPDPTGASDAGTSTNVNYVYVQAFDPATAQSLGPARPFFPANFSDKDFSLILEAAAIAPTGQIALLYWSSTTAGLGVAFLDSTTGDAGVGPVNLRVVRQVPLESSGLWSQPHAIWSATYGAFVFSWEYSGANGPMKVRKFLADGRSAGGDTDSVPTTRDDNLVNGGGASGTVSASGRLFAVSYLEYGTGHPFLTVLNALGNQVGSTLAVQREPANAKWVTSGGTSAGFLAFYDQGGIAATLVPVSPDGVVGAPGGLDGGALPGFHFTGTKQAVYARAINDDVGGAGGVGLAILYNDGLAFAYVSADGLTHVGPASVISHAYDGAGAGGTPDYISISNFAGSFAISLFSHSEKKTFLVASSCQ